MSAAAVSLPPCFSKIDNIKNPGDLKEGDLEGGDEGGDYYMKVFGEATAPEEIWIYMVDPDMDPELKSEPNLFGEEVTAAYLNASIDYDDEEGNELTINQIWVPAGCRGRKFASFFLWKLAQYVSSLDGVDISVVELNDFSDSSLRRKSGAWMLTKEEIGDLIRKKGDSIYAKFGFSHKFYEEDGKQSTNIMVATLPEFKGAVDAQWEKVGGGAGEKRRRRRRRVSKKRGRGRGGGGGSGRRSRRRPRK